MFPAFPIEILNLIFELLSDNFSDLKTCSLVSTTWHAAATRILFSELHLLCSMDHPNLTALHPKSKRQLDLVYGVIPVYRKKGLRQNTDVHCVCNDLQNLTVQSFCLNGASTSVHITQNVTRLNLVFCSISSSPTEQLRAGPHSLQLYPDLMISSLLQSIDKLSFIHLRHLIIDSAPQVLYFMNCEPFSGVLSSAASSLEEICFSSFESMQSSDIKRLLNKHAFSCTRFPRLHRLAFRGLFNVSDPYGPKMNCALEFTRVDSNSLRGVRPASVSVGVSYSSYQDPSTKPDGFSKFDLPGWCCFSGLCTTSQEPKLFVDALSLGTGVRDWSLPTIGIIMEAFQSNALGQFARSLDVKVSSDINDPSGIKLFSYISQTYPRISSLNLCFGSIVDMRLALLRSSQQGPDRFSSATTIISQQLLLFAGLSTLRFTLYGNAGFMIAFALNASRNESQHQTMNGDQRPRFRPNAEQIQDQLDIVTALDVLIADLALTSTNRQHKTTASSELHPTVLLQEVVVELDVGPTSVTDEWLSKSTAIERELEMMFLRTRAANPRLLTVQAL
ncbi:hypothetical protein F5890DRAFT_1475337 [Lentinula detonsa]|uniref:F-box domain-containing protein n=1 Tax=Lentinula detonsa TaxID=2804962 RepID=A0AA38PXA7_9AGAR|nr:hypothetical protein F5890DRAFT_1475337 [Lentinula detonsa]